MRPATWKDKKRIIEIISATFENNPGSVWLLRNNVNRRKAIRCLAEYVFVKAYNRKGAYISSNNKGMALCYRFNYKSFSLYELFCLTRFSVLYGSFKRANEISYREKYRVKKRPVDGNYLYWWFFGVQKDGDRAGFEIAKEIVELSEKINLPIYLETAMERNMKVYERYGYRVFHYWEEKDKDIQYWFMRRLPGVKRHNDDKNQ